MKREDDLVPCLANQTFVEIIPLYRQVTQMQRSSGCPARPGRLPTAD